MTSQPEETVHRVLVVDDNEAIQQFIAEVLTSWGPFANNPCVVEAASGVDEARSQLSQNRYDLIILDMMLPDGNGLQVLEFLDVHEFRPPVIVVSADDPIDLRRRAMEMGASAFLRKGDGVEALVREALTLLDASPVAATGKALEGGGTPADWDHVTGRILVVDDDALVCDALASMMELLENVDVRTAHGGRAGLEIAREWEPHVILLDIAMPDMDGRQTLQALTDLGLRARVIMVSAFRDADVAKECVQRGAVDYIPKPVDFPFLKRAVVAHLVLAKQEVHSESEGK